MHPKRASGVVHVIQGIPKGIRLLTAATEATKLAIHNIENAQFHVAASPHLSHLFFMCRWHSFVTSQIRFWERLMRWPKWTNRASAYGVCVCVCGRRLFCVGVKCQNRLLHQDRVRCRFLVCRTWSTATIIRINGLLAVARHTQAIRCNGPRRQREIFHEWDDDE